MRLFRILLPLLVLASPLVASAAPRTLQELAGILVTVLDNATAVLIVLGIVIYFYGISTNIMKSGESDREKLRSYLVWGIIVLFVMVSIWGILNLLESTLFGDSASATGSASNSQQTSADPFGSPHFLSQ